MLTGVWHEGDKTFNIGNVIHGYNLMIFIGLLLCCFGIIYFWRRMKYPWTVLQIMMIISIPTGIFGSRIWTCIWDGGWESFFTFAGLSIQGGVVIGMICTVPYVWYVRRLVDFRTVFGIVIPNILIAQSIGRFGNFFNHELFGPVVSGDSLNWMGLMKPHMLIYTVRDGFQYRAPMFFYESMSTLGGWVLLVPVLLRKNWLKPGVVGALYWVWYGIWRAIFEPYKDEPWVTASGFQIATFICGISIAVGTLVAVYWQWLCFPLKEIVFKTPGMVKSFSWLNILIRKWNNVKFAHFPREYEKITPVKPRRTYEWFGAKTDNKKKYIFWGPEVPNKVILWIPIEKEQRKWSKREINRGFRAKARHRRTSQ